ncbi:MAG TPA: hypothetical protein VKX40_02350 [Aequorivita sp.]|nr:hypothetical protein [Aequorivita sp.]
MYLKLLFFGLTLSIMSCNSSKTSQNVGTTSTIENSTDMDLMDEQKLIEDGFVKGIVVHSEIEGDCPYTIKMENGPGEFYYLDPVNMDESFKKDGEEVWIKFRGLRRMNRCNKANPVEIVEIKKGG